MSGRDVFIDPSVVLDIDQQLQFSVACTYPNHVAWRNKADRPSAPALIALVQNAAALLTKKDETIDRLEMRQRAFEDLAVRLKVKIGEMLRLQHDTDTKARLEAERADKAHERACRLQSRVYALEKDLDATVSDLHRIGEIITRSLVTPARDSVASQSASSR